MGKDIRGGISCKWNADTQRKCKEYQQYLSNRNQVKKAGTASEKRLP
jgi:hypothetical protein